MSTVGATDGSIGLSTVGSTTIGGRVRGVASITLGNTMSMGVAVGLPFGSDGNSGDESSSSEFHVYKVSFLFD